MAVYLRNMIDKYIQKHEQDLLHRAYSSKEFMFLNTETYKRFYSLLPWKEINRILRQGCISHKRIRLFREGRVINPALYIDNYEEENRQLSPKISESGLYSLLKDGATLIINGVDDLYHELDEFTSALEKHYKTRVQVNAYVSWHSIKGFDTHWDHHDVLILQIVGDKNWSLYGKTREYPMYEDFHTKENPPKKSVWNKTIKEGDMLFIPRGHWHSAKAINEPSLHLTFSFEPLTMKHYLKWLQEELVYYETFRKDIPLFGSEDEIIKYETEILELISKEMKKNDIRCFIKEHTVRMLNRPLFSLPHGVLNIPINKEKVILNASTIFDYQLDVDEKTVSFCARSKNYIFSVYCAPFFELLMDYKPHPYEECFIIVKENIKASEFNNMLHLLIGDGLLSVMVDD
jgi:hypothetical protein